MTVCGAWTRLRLDFVDSNVVHSSHILLQFECCLRPSGRDYVATRLFCGPPLILPPAPKRWRPPECRGLCSHPTQVWANSEFAPALKRWGPPKRQGLCSHRADLWAIFDCVPCSKAVGILRAVRVMQPPGPTCRPPLILTSALKRWGPLRQQRLCSHPAHLWANSSPPPPL